MAKDVDLSSKEWCDIVFEGKNKDFGAYEMRSGSTKRHNRAMIIVVIALALILAFLIMYMTGVFAPKEEAETATTVDVELTTMEVEEAQPEEEEEQIIIPEPEPEIPQIEEDVKQQLLTEAVIVDVVDDDKKMQDQEKIKEDDSKISIKNVTDGAEDFTSQDQLKKEVVVVEEPVKHEPDKVFEAVEQMPTYPGGEAALYKDLNSNIKYPTEAAEEGIQGRVVVRFVVTKTGAIDKVSIARGKHPALDKEAIRVVKTLKKFIPGKQNGEAVNVWYSLPISFKLNQ